MIKKKKKPVSWKREAMINKSALKRASEVISSIRIPAEISFEHADKSTDELITEFYDAAEKDIDYLEVL